MASVTNAPFRLVARECGSALTTTEEMDAIGLLQDSPHVQACTAYYPEERPLAMQLLGKDAEALARAAVRLEVLGADIVDLNMGCPVHKITSRGKGAALMRDLPGAARILGAMRRAIRVPLTVKIRGGWDDTHLNAVEVARMAESEGVDAITVHPRTRSQQFTGKAPWTIIGEVVAAVGVPVTGNGDVRSMDDARRMVRETGCQSVMIGRGALGRPWVFDPTFDALDPALQREAKARVIGRHVALIQEHFPSRYALVQLKKHLAWYTEGLGHAAACRSAIFASHSATDVWDTFRRYGDASRPEPAELALA